MLKLNVEKLKQTVKSYDGTRTAGRLRSARGLLSAKLEAKVGDLCSIQAAKECLGEVIGFDKGIAQILPFDSLDGVSPNALVTSLHRKASIPTGIELLGRVIDGLGRPIDNKNLHASEWIPVDDSVPAPMTRTRIQQPFITGQRVIDGLLTIGQGQRVGLFAGSGVGKSTLLGEIAKGAQSDINVIAMIGERGREVRPFLDDCVGVGMNKSIAIVSTANQSPLLRVRAAQSAISIADSFRKQGANVLLMLDSLTRVATAQREIGLMREEIPSARGYTPSVFGLIANLIEQLGSSDKGSITGILTVLVDGDEMDDPLADSVRSLVDGHIVLSRILAEKQIFPAIDVNQSISRVVNDITTEEHQAAMRTFRKILAIYSDVEELIQVGAYAKQQNPDSDLAIDLMPALRHFANQRIGEHNVFQDTVSALQKIANAWPFDQQRRG